MVDAKRAVEILKTLGMRDASTVGKQHARFPMVERHLLLTGLWRAVLADDATWSSKHSEPVAKVLAAGVDPSDLTAIVRQAQVDLLFEVCQLLDRSDHGIEDLQSQIPENVEWRVCEYDGERETVGRPMQDLHASFFHYDPTGREGQPTPGGKPAAKTTAKSKRAIRRR
jgi:hypothetical protein|nr:hypothetical protein [Kofleriaceae bacterium]